MRNDSRYGGYIYLLQGVGINMNRYGGLQFGGDLRWTTPLKGLVVGASHVNQDITGKGSVNIPGFATGPYEVHSNRIRPTRFTANIRLAICESKPNTAAGGAISRFSTG